jgi:hypothetical protein
VGDGRGTGTKIEAKQSRREDSFATMAASNAILQRLWLEMMMHNMYQTIAC